MYVVCGYYTPDYAHWLPPLVESLEAVGAPHDFVAIEKEPGGWEANTRCKARQLSLAMQRHPSEVVIFVDVDCTVRGDLSALDRARGDIALHLSTKRRLKGARLRVRSGTIVARPTREACCFVDAWVRACGHARIGDNDQTTLAMAMNQVSGVTFQLLEKKWCATMWENVPDAVIVHDIASRSQKRLGRISQIVRRARAWWSDLMEMEFNPYWDVEDWRR